MNNALYEIASFMVLRESVVWRWSHTRHHSDTIIVGRDREIAGMRPVSLIGILLKFVNIPTIFRYYQSVLRHAIGRVAPHEHVFIPASEFNGLFWRARIYVVIYLGVLALAIGTRSILPLLFIGLPNIYGAWLQVIYGIQQHAGLAEDVLDHRLNTRTVYMNAINRFLYWNMGWRTPAWARLVSTRAHGPSGFGTRPGLLLTARSRAYPDRRPDHEDHGP